MEIKVELTGLLAASANFRKKTIEVPDGTTIAEALKIINLPVSGNWIKHSVNGKLINKRYVLKDGDNLLFFPVGGGG